MSKSIKSAAVLVGLSALVVTQLALAASGNLSVSISCPDIGNSGTEKVSNSGGVLLGKGSERLRLGGGVTKDTHPLFSGVAPAGVPVDLVAGGYHNSGTNYSVATNAVTCSFASALGNPSFDISYTLHNISNGEISSSGPEEIKIKFDVGLAG